MSRGIIGRAEGRFFAARMRTPAVNAAGDTSLGIIVALLERAALLVTNDTGISHLAARCALPASSCSWNRILIVGRQ
jgi:ADP-heptose:LPS heptosyltransferase